MDYAFGVLKIHHQTPGQIMFSCVFTGSFITVHFHIKSAIHFSLIFMKVV